MKVILTEDVKSLGKAGDVVDVSDGYARNFLLSKKKGLEATPANMNNLKLKKANEERIQAQQLADARALAEELKEKRVRLTIKAGTGGKTFGSVTSKEIAEALQSQHGIEVDKKKVVLKDPIKAAGSYTAQVKLHPQVPGELGVDVVEE